MVRFERAFVWFGGAAFAASLAVTVFAYGVTWSVVRPFDPRAAAPALAIDLLLFGLFASHHSVFARDRVKACLARQVPDHLLRSVYVWVSSVLWTAVVVGWRPIGGVAFRHAGALAVAHAVVQAAGLLLIARSVRAIDALELAGIRQASSTTGLQNRGPYRLVRHPLYLGWMLVVFGTGTMTGDRLAFAVVTSIYLVVAIPWEERSLERVFGDAYRRYRQQVRWRVVPFVY